MRKYVSHLGKKLNSDQRGVILIWLIFILVVAGVLGSSMVYLTTSATYDELLANNQARAYYIAEAGGRYVTPIMQQNPATAFTDINGNTFILSNGDQFMISNMNIINNPMTVVSTGIVNAGSWLEGRRKITYSLIITHPFQQAVYGSGDITLDNDAVIDSYDSSIGVYGGSNVGSNGDVTTETNSISLKNGAVINGDQTTNASSDFSPVSLPEEGEPLIPFIYDIDDTNEILSSNTFRAELVKLDNNAQLSISGEVELIVENDFTLSNNASIVLELGATLSIYVNGNILFDNVSQGNADSVPENVIIYGTSNTAIVELKNNSTVYAVIYAPDSFIKLDNDAQLFGAIIGDQVHLSNRAEVHFDEALITTTKVFDDEVPLIVGSIIQY